MADESSASGVPAAEASIDLGRAQAPTQAEDSVAETFTCGSNVIVFLKTHFLKGGKCIGAEHFGPFVGVIASCVTACKDVAEGAEKAVFLHGLHHAGGFSDAATECIRADLQLRCPLAVEAQVGQSEMDLSKGAIPLQGSCKLPRAELGTSELMFSFNEF